MSVARHPIYSAESGPYTLPCSDRDSRYYYSSANQNNDMPNSLVTGWKMNFGPIDRRPSETVLVAYAAVAPSIKASRICDVANKPIVG